MHKIALLASLTRLMMSWRIHFRFEWGIYHSILSPLILIGWHLHFLQWSIFGLMSWAYRSPLMMGKLTPGPRNTAAANSCDNWFHHLMVLSRPPKQFRQIALHGLLASWCQSVACHLSAHSLADWPFSPLHLQLLTISLSKVYTVFWDS